MGTNAALRVSLALSTALALVASNVAAADTTLFEISGKGAHRSRPIAVSGPWEVQWKADAGVFEVYLQDAAGEKTRVGNLLGGGEGSSYQTETGVFIIEV